MTESGGKTRNGRARVVTIIACLSMILGPVCSADGSRLNRASKGRLRTSPLSVEDRLLVPRSVPDTDLRLSNAVEGRDVEEVLGDAAADGLAESMTTELRGEFPGDGV